MKGAHGGLAGRYTNADNLRRRREAASGDGMKRRRDRVQTVAARHSSCQSSSPVDGSASRCYSNRNPEWLGPLRSTLGPERGGVHFSSCRPLAVGLALIPTSCRAESTKKVQDSILDGAEKKKGF